MKEITGLRVGRRSARATRLAVTAAAIAAAPLLAAACGGSHPASGADQTQMQQALNFAQCVRSHGAPNYPDPNSSGVFVETPQNYTEFQLPGSAAAACNHLQPRKPVLSPAMQAKQFRANLALANCMHQRGYPNFPDSWGGGIHVDQFASLGIDVNSPQFNAAMKTCGWH